MICHIGWFLSVPPIGPRRPLDTHIYILNICKEHLGSRGRGGGRDV